MKFSWSFIPLLLAAAVKAQAPPAQAGRPGESGGTQTLSIAEVIQEALNNNLGLLAERANLPVAEAARITARLRPNPVVSASADHLDTLGSGFNEVNGAGPPEYSFRIDLPIERARKRELRTETASFAMSIAEARLNDAIRQLRLEVQLACIDIVEANAKLKLAQDNLTSLERLVALNENRLASGAIAPLEVTRARVAMLQYRSGVRVAELELATAHARLFPLLGRRSTVQTIDVAGDLRMPPPAGPVELGALESLALSSRPDLQTLQREQARSQADLRLQIAQGKVDYSVGMEYRRQQGINGTGNMLGFFFSAPLPVFNRNQGEIARAQAEGEKARRSIRALENEILAEVFTAFQEYDKARQLVAEIEKDLLTSSAEALKTTTYVYQAGATTLLDVLDAQRAFNETMLTYYSSQASYTKAATRLAAVAGKEALP